MDFGRLGLGISRWLQCWKLYVTRSAETIYLWLPFPLPVITLRPGGNDRKGYCSGDDRSYRSLPYLPPPPTPSPPLSPSPESCFKSRRFYAPGEIHQKSTEQIPYIILRFTSSRPLFQFFPSGYYCAGTGRWVPPELLSLKGVWISIS